MTRDPWYKVVTPRQEVREGRDLAAPVKRLGFPVGEADDHNILYYFYLPAIHERGRSGALNTALPVLPASPQQLQKRLRAAPTARKRSR